MFGSKFFWPLSCLNNCILLSPMSVRLKVERDTDTKKSVFVCVCAVGRYKEHQHGQALTECVQTISQPQ